MWVKASAPGSLMLFGEHAVLAGYPAIVAAINNRVTVELKPRLDRVIGLQSNLFAPYNTSIEKLQLLAPYQFVLAALMLYQSQLPSGCDIMITTHFSDKIGFGSSAAVTVATLSALRVWLGLSESQAELLSAGVSVIQTVQSVGSGADVAAAIAGKVILFQPHLQEITQLPCQFQLAALYAGYKTKTPAVIAHVQKYFADQPTLLAAIYAAIGEVVQHATRAFLKNDLATVGRLMRVQQSLLAALQVSDANLDHLIKVFEDQSAILGAKISGSGLGDCVIGLRELQSTLSLPMPHEAITIEIADQGVWCERIE